MLSRREMLRRSVAVSSAVVLGQSILSPVSAADDADAALAKLGWKIGPQIYSFRLFPFDEAVKKVKECKAASFELYGSQPITKGSEIKIGPGLLKPENADAFKLFKDLLAENGVKPHSMGVCPASREYFDFAAACGFNVLNVEPKFEILPEVSKLAEEYKFYIGLHNHPKPSIYWDPDVVLAQLKDASPRIGSCADTGHWLRSGLVPVECIRKLKGRIHSFHIKDLKKTEKGNYSGGDVPLGQGEVGIADILKEIATQKTAQAIPFSIEFEAHWDSNQPLIAEGIEFFKKTAKEIAG